MQGADHEESSPDASLLLVSKLTCSLVGDTRAVHFADGSLTRRIYGTEKAMEVFACNYGLNDAFSEKIASKDLLITGKDDDGTVRVVELPGHPFFVATLYVPQVISTPEKPHPLIVAYLRATGIRAGLSMR